MKHLIWLGKRSCWCWGISGRNKKGEDQGRWWGFVVGGWFFGVSCWPGNQPVSTTRLGKGEPETKDGESG